MMTNIIAATQMQRLHSVRAQASTTAPESVEIEITTWPLVVDGVPTLISASYRIILSEGEARQLCNDIGKVLGGD